jgi:hypothetical protein
MLTRRDFVASVALLPLSAAAPRSALKTALNAYSFNKLLNDSMKGRGPGVTLVQVLELSRPLSGNAPIMARNTGFASAFRTMVIF